MNRKPIFNKDTYKRYMISPEGVKKKINEQQTVLNTVEDDQQEGKIAGEFSQIKSSCSCMISEIESFLIGGSSSRFWILRKHINSMNEEQLKNLQFYSWCCITLRLARRDIDLVIKDEKQMSIFLTFLIYSLKTIDGIKNTAVDLIKGINQKSLEEFKTQTG